MPEEVIYPFDPDASLESNYIKDEYHTVTSVNAAPYRILIPKLAPFYVESFKAFHIDNLGVERLLTEGVDYYFALPYVGATRSTGKAVYGGIPIITSMANGAIRLEYRTLGGEWCVDRDYAYVALLEQVYNPRTTWWENITNVQAVFPPTPHTQPIDDVEGIEVMLEALGGISQAILQAPTMVPAQYLAHMLAKGNVHNLTPEDLGLGNAATLDIATDEEVFMRESLDKAVTLRQILSLLNG